VLGKRDRDHFGRIWKRQLAVEPDPHYTRGANQRVDKALRYLKGGKRLLDIGCGTGVLLAQVSQRYSEACGVEISPEAVRVARRRGIRADLVNVNSNPLPYPDRYFDVITLLATLQLTYDPIWTLRESNRVLRPGGTLVMTVPNVRAFWRLGRLLVQGWFARTSLDPEGYDGGTLHYFAFRNVKSLLHATGFDVRTAHGIFCLPKFMRYCPDWGLPGALKREFFGAETFIVAQKVAAN
jgi:methionine biosynthesis protein MetW